MKQNLIAHYDPVHGDPVTHQSSDQAATVSESSFFMLYALVFALVTIVSFILREREIKGKEKGRKTHTQ